MLDAWELHRNRFGIHGHLFKQIEYEVEREFTEKELTEKDILAGVTPKSLWKDVNVNLTYVKNAQVQVGKFKVPFGLDQLTGVTHNDFVYRSLGANYLAPARDIGVMVHGRFFKRGLELLGRRLPARWRQRAVEEDRGRRRDVRRPRHRNAVPQDCTSSPLAVIEVGSSFAISALSDDSFRPNGLRGRTVMTPGHVLRAGVRERAPPPLGSGRGLDGRARRRRATEYTWVSDDRNGQGIGDEDLPDARARSWYVSGTWVADRRGQEAAAQAGRADFLQGGIGAVEVVARVRAAVVRQRRTGDRPPFRNPRAETILPTGDHVADAGRRTGH